ncbi:hypothetical protein sscle_05g045250 [Sclerotinia sclerotiorum 1980 UF-70]|uniref:Uncharacterized protein n=1 Tax=Sclerotinia sclerotiorum (strain ATCC 18683 / 1980 / Ss-1) TaxID=665079 RepID=A0A1D9Q481_SCLS1|nr:hypothetical protein sscle_05g045250 [Sclerotinia sclerotiorum 1980 UF-70]
MSPTNWRKIIDAAKRIPPQHCQTFVVALVSELERKALLPGVTAVHLLSRMEMPEEARVYRENHPDLSPLSDELRERRGSQSNRAVLALRRDHACAL